MTRNRREFITQSAAAVSGAMLGAGAISAAAQESSAANKLGKTPNLVFVFPDQFRPQAMGFCGEDPVHTPHIDRFAGQSLVLDQAVSNTPICSPFRAMLMTGNYYTNNNVPTNCVTGGAYQAELRTNDVCFTDVLSGNGYHQAYFGKWHLEYPRPPFVPSGNNNPAKNRCWEDWTPPDRRHSVDIWHAYNTWDDHFHPHYWTNESTRDERLEVSQWSPIHEANCAIDYIENKGGIRPADQPFACFVSMNPPHTPYALVPDKYREPYRDMPFEKLCNRPNVKPGSRGEQIARASLADYFACVTGVDEQFGRILAALDRAGVADDTIVVLTSDHGNCVGCHNQPTKGNSYEESFRIPMIVRHPGQLKPRTDSLLLSAPDIYPTVTGMLGATDRPSTQGVDYSDVLLEREPADGGKPIERPEAALFAMARGGGKRRENDDLTDGRRGVRTSRYTLDMNKNEAGEITEVKLFDNQEDPYQLTNIAADRPAVVRSLVEDSMNPRLKAIDDPWLENKTS